MTSIDDVVISHQIMTIMMIMVHKKNKSISFLGWVGVRGSWKMLRSGYSLRCSSLWCACPVALLM
jgi:hypothetical protein